MSSDSDSDFCDFSTDFNKKNTQSLNSFWDNYKTKQSTINPEDDLRADNQDRPTVVERVSEYLSKDDPDVGSGSACKIQTTPSLETKTNDDVVLVVQSEENIQCRIADKLEKLTETIKDILDDGVKPKRRCRKQCPKKPNTVKPRASRRKKAPVSVKAEIDPVVYINDDDGEVAKKTIEHVEELNPSVTIKVLWKMVETKIFKVRKFQRLDCIYDYYMNEANVDPKLLYFTIDDKEINLQENSYISLRLGGDKFIEGSTLPESYIDKPKSNPLVEKSGLIMLKVQNSVHRSKQFDVHCLSGDKMEIVMWQVTRHVNQDVENIKLLFDGQVLKPSDTVEQLGLEEGDCFDLTVIN